MIATPAKQRQKFTVRISKSGQITLPAAIRQKLGVEVGDQVEFVEAKDGTIQVKAIKHLSIAELAGSLGPPPDGKTLTEYIRDVNRTPMVRSVYEGSEKYDPD